MEFTKEEALKELNSILEDASVFTHEDEMNFYFKNTKEFFKVRKFDSALHYRFNENEEWQYDMDLFDEE
jgi:hypothetical protein